MQFLFHGRFLWTGMPLAALLNCNSRMPGNPYPQCCLPYILISVTQKIQENYNSQQLVCFFLAMCLFVSIFFLICI